MSYQSCVLEGLYALRWGPTPEVRDVDAYVSEIAAARSAQKAQLVGLFIMPEDSAPPDDVFRKAQAKRFPEIFTNLEFAVAVFEGQGFISSLKRSALVAITLLAPKRYPLHVRATVEEALKGDPPAPIRFDVNRAIADLRRAGLC